MRTIIAFALAIGLTVWQSDALFAQRAQLPGNVYIYPDGTTGYYQGNYRSNYYTVPSVISGNQMPSYLDGARRYSLPPRFPNAINRWNDPRDYRPAYRPYGTR